MNDQKNAPVIISLGGSLVVPDGIDTAFLKAFRELIVARISQGERFVLVVGGGRTARIYQDAAQTVAQVTDEDRDWLGIHATRINAHLLRTIFRDVAHAEIVTDPHTPMPFAESVLVASGWRPGRSTDYIAVTLAKQYGSTMVINLSNIDQVYTTDPRKDASAQPLPTVSWDDYIAIIPEKWSPGLSSPFDPVASREAREHQISVSIINGAHLDRLENCLDKKEFLGTVIS
jgi:uridylate kinase